MNTERIEQDARKFSNLYNLVNNSSTYVGLCASTVRKTKNAKNRGLIILLLYLFACDYSIRTATNIILTY